MGQLRELLAEYVSLTAYYDEKPLLSGEKLEEYFHKLMYLQQRIKLHLNHSGAKDKEIDEIIGEINFKISGVYFARNILNIPLELRLKHILDNGGRVAESLMNDVAKSVNDVAQSVKINFKGTYDPNDNSDIQTINIIIKELNEKFIKSYGINGKKELVRLTDDLVTKTRIYLKEEWERVKQEAEHGKINK